jgi:putative hydrolase of the HAD superfamily
VTVDAVLFDLDDTLLEYRRSPADLLDASFAAAGVEPVFGVDDYYDRYDEFAAEHDDADALRRTCFEALAAEGGADPAVGRRVAAEYATMRDHRDVQFRPGAREALDALAGDYRLGIVTNGAPSTQRPKYDALGLHDDGRFRFGAVIHAGTDTPPKPDPTPFRLALDTLDAVPDRAIHVGNSHPADVVGARNAGVASVWIPATDYDRRQAEGRDVDPDHALDSLAGLPALVDEADRRR